MSFCLVILKAVKNLKMRLVSKGNINDFDNLGGIKKRLKRN